MGFGQGSTIPASDIGIAGPDKAGRRAFYGGYCLFEVPSNLILEKIGVRFWLSHVMIIWRPFSGAIGLLLPIQ